MGINAAQALSDLISKRVEAKIVVPASLKGKVESSAGAPGTLADFFYLLPKVIQLDIGGKELPFPLLLLPQNKGAHLDQGQADIINRLLVDYNPATYDESVFWNVPTYFYNTGSVMVVQFIPYNLGLALHLIEENPEVLS